MTLLNSINTAAIEPSQYATKVASNYKTATCGESITARILFVAQLIMSVIALPIILVLGLISTIVQAFDGKGGDACNEWGKFLKQHLFILIPTSFVGIFAPLEATDSCFHSTSKCFAQTEHTGVAGDLAGAAVDLGVRPTRT